MEFIVTIFSCRCSSPRCEHHHKWYSSCRADIFSTLQSDCPQWLDFGASDKMAITTREHPFNRRRADSWKSTNHWKSIKIDHILYTIQSIVDFPWRTIYLPSNCKLSLSNSTTIYYKNRKCFCTK